MWLYCSVPLGEGTGGTGGTIWNDKEILWNLFFVQRLSGFKVKVRTEFAACRVYTGGEVFFPCRVVSGLILHGTII